MWILYGDGDSAFTLTYASATSFTVAGINVTAKYHAGRRVKATGMLTGTIFGTISSSSFSTNTTVNVAWDSGSLENEAITIYLGMLSATNQSIPPGFNGGITGEVRMFAGAAAPTGWLLCQGQAVSRTAFATLFAVIGTTWGAGDGSTTFNIPDLRGRMLVGAGQGSGLTNRALGAKGGSETISVAAMSSHAHPFSATTSTHAGHNHGFWARASATSVNESEDPTYLLGNNDQVGTAYGGPVASGGSHSHTISGTTDGAGSGAADGNMSPFVVGNWIIKT
jgi:microcystin-dependent protein